MRAALVSAALVACSLACRGAAAQSMVATRPGLMCTQAGALAILTLPDGSDRGASPRAHPEDEATKHGGGCIDIPPGARVAVHQRRINTSIVSFDAGDGLGERVWIVPNIDFSVEHQTAVASAPIGPAGPEAPAPPPADPISAFFNALQERCPERGWEKAAMEAYGPPLEEAAKTLSPQQHQSLAQEVGSACAAGDSLECGNTIAIRHLVQAGRLWDVTRAFCSVAPAAADSVRY